MSTSKPFAADEESVLMAFSMEPSHGQEALERYIRSTTACDCADRLFDRSAS
jgi:hypothetical protein